MADAMKPANGWNETIQSDEFKALSASPPAREEAPAEGAVWSAIRNLFVTYSGPYAEATQYEYASAIADKAARDIEAALRNRTPEPARESWASMAKWTEETFGPVSLERIATRANEEMQELLADPSDVMEAADVCIVLSRYPGIEDAINRKMAINRKREWRLNGDGSGYHVKTGEAYTHPAPATADKLKVAKETLEKIARRTSITFGRGEMSNQEAFSLAEYGLACLNEQPQ